METERFGRLASWKKLSSKLALECDHPQCFVESQWKPKWRWKCMTRRWYLIYRWICFLHFFVFLLVFFFLTPDLMRYGLEWRHKGFFFIYLTSWATIVITVDTGIQAYIVTAAAVRQNAGHSDNLCFLYQVSWILETVNIDMALMITLIYWGFLHESDKGPPSYATVEAHLMNSVYIVINICISARPVRRRHVIFPLVTGFVYIVFSVAYSLGGGSNPHDWGPYIYTILDWRDPGQCIGYIAIVFVGIFVTHLIHWRFSHNKSRWICGGDTTEETDGSEGAGTRGRQAEEAAPLNASLEEGTEDEATSCMKMCLSDLRRKDKDEEYRHSALDTNSDETKELDPNQNRTEDKNTDPEDHQTAASGKKTDLYPTLSIVSENGCKEFQDENPHV